MRKNKLIVNKPNLFVVLLLLFTLIVHLNCQKETVEKREYPRLKTLKHSVQPEGVWVYAEILSQGDEKIIDHGVAWNTISTIDLPNSENISLGELNDNRFDVLIDRNVELGRKYYAMPYIVTENYTVFGELVKFEGKEATFKPEITDFAPKKGNAGDTVTIYGRNFSNIFSNLHVKFGEETARIVSNSVSEIKVIVPEIVLRSTKITLTIKWN